jgi:hypothetical protein
MSSKSKVSNKLFYPCLVIICLLIIIGVYLIVQNAKSNTEGFTCSSIDFDTKKKYYIAHLDTDVTPNEYKLLNFINNNNYINRPISTSTGNLSYIDVNADPSKIRYFDGRLDLNYTFTQDSSNCDKYIISNYDNIPISLTNKSNDPVLVICPPYFIFDKIDEQGNIIGTIRNKGIDNPQLRDPALSIPDICDPLDGFEQILTKNSTGVYKFIKMYDLENPNETTATSDYKIIDIILYENDLNFTTTTAPTTTAPTAPTTTAPTTTTPISYLKDKLTNKLKPIDDKLEIDRFKTLRNQQYLNNLTRRVNELQKTLEIKNYKPLYDVSGKLTFY